MEAAQPLAAARLTARPAAPTEPPPERRGTQPLDAGGRRPALLHVPERLDLAKPAPLLVVLHGGGSGPDDVLGPLREEAELARIALLAPASEGRTWDALLGGFGPDAAAIDRALARTFARLAVDARRLGIAGFSDGATYALSLGLANGDLFEHVLAFSPGFAAPPGHRGTPRIFVSHGDEDPVLAIDRTSRRLVPELRAAGYEVRYEEFPGGHLMPPGLVADALAWLRGK